MPRETAVSPRPRPAPGAAEHRLGLRRPPLIADRAAKLAHHNAARDRRFAALLGQLQGAAEHRLGLRHPPLIADRAAKFSHCGRRSGAVVITEAKRHRLSKCCLGSRQVPLAQKARACPLKHGGEGRLSARDPTQPLGFAQGQRRIGCRAADRSVFAGRQVARFIGAAARVRRLWLDTDHLERTDHRSGATSRNSGTTHGAITMTNGQSKCRRRGLRR